MKLKMKVKSWLASYRNEKRLVILTRSQQAIVFYLDFAFLLVQTLALASIWKDFYASLGNYSLEFTHLLLTSYRNASLG